MSRDPPNESPQAPSRAPTPAGHPLLTRATAVLLLGILSSGCAGRLSSQGDVERTVGRATLRDIVVEVPTTLRRQGYVLYTTRRTERTVYFETSWRTRPPFEDEAESGASAARTRLVVRGREAGGNFYSLKLHAENQLQGLPSASDFSGTGWSTMPPTRMFKNYVRELSTAIRLQVDMGVRVR